MNVRHTQSWPVLQTILTKAWKLHRRVQKTPFLKRTVQLREARMTSHRVTMCVLGASYTVNMLISQLLNVLCKTPALSSAFFMIALTCRLLGIVLVSGIVSTQAQLSQVRLSKTCTA